MDREDTKKKRKKNKLTICPLFIMVCATSLAMMIYGVVEANSGKYVWELTWDHPVFAAVLLDERPAPEETEAEDVQAADADGGDDSDVSGDAADAVEVMAEGETETDDASGEEETESESETEPLISDEEYMEMYGEIPYYVDGGGEIKYITWDTGEPRSRYYDNPGIRPLTSEYPYVHVTDPVEYYDSCLFVGDSRIGGLGTYSGWEKAFFAYKNGLSIYGLMEKELNVINGMNATLPTLLQVGPYKRIYIMLGINEVGTSTAEYGEKFGEALATIREYQPDAPIIIIGNTFVTKSKDQSSNSTNNANINSKNVAIAKYANGKDIFYYDVNPVLVDDEGYLREEISRDGVHLLAQHYYLWIDWMNEHGFREEGVEYAEDHPEWASEEDDGEDTDNEDGADDSEDGGEDPEAGDSDQ